MHVLWKATQRMCCGGDGRGIGGVPGYPGISIAVGGHSIHSAARTLQLCKESPFP